MKYVKVAGVAWGLIYFVMGAIFSFTLGSNDFWSGVTFFLSTYFLSLPITILAVWFPRVAGTALLICIAISVASIAVAVPEKGMSVLSIAINDIPNLAFAVAYIMLGRASKNADSGDEGSSVGVA
jgi:hypothetical protein